MLLGAEACHTLIIVPMPPNSIIQAFKGEFDRYRKLAEGAVSQLELNHLRQPLDPDTNSIAVIMKHVGGNLRSRWTDPFTADGEKPWRDRDREFIDDFADRAALESHWHAGWDAIDTLLNSATDADLQRTVRIRGEALTLAQALARSVAHTACHCGQIVLLARHAASIHSLPWRTLTVPRGGSAAHNRGMGFDEGSVGGTRS